MAKRFPWKKVLGETIVQWAARQRAMGRTKEQAIQELHTILEALERNNHLPPGWTLWEAKEHAAKTITARWAEHSDALKSYISEKKTLAVFAATIRQAKDGGLYVYVSPKVAKKLELFPGDALLLKVLKVKWVSKGRYAWEYVDKEEGGGGGNIRKGSDVNK